MGSRKSAQGQSESTGPKEALISMCVGWALQYVRDEHGRYCVFDLNAGSPVNVVANRRYRGTTRTVLDKLEKSKRRASLWWCDLDATAARALEPFMPVNGHLFGEAPRILVHVVHGDNTAVAASIPDRVCELGQPPKSTRGVIIADPNGLAVPLTSIKSAIAAAPYLDVVIHLSSFKQVWAYWDKYGRSNAERCRETGQRVGSFWEVFTMLPKASWLISEPFRPASGHGRDHVVLFGSNLRNVPPITKHGLPPMYRVDSADGRRVLQEHGRWGFDRHGQAA